MTQKEYALLGLGMGWESAYALNYLFNRLLTNNPQISDLELFNRQSSFCLLSTGVIAQSDGRNLRLISDDNQKLEESREYLAKLLNNMELIEI